VNNFRVPEVHTVEMGLIQSVGTDLYIVDLVTLFVKNIDVIFRYFYLIFYWNEYGKISFTFLLILYDGNW
jgi:hypothetical protein